MFVDSFQEKIWKDKYQYGGETYDDFCLRIASNVFPDDKIRQEVLINTLGNFEALFGGRINSNIGISEEGLTLFNCFIESIVENPDSLEGILEMVKAYAITLKTEGGVGFCANFLRPAKTLIKKIGVTTPGAIKFLEIFDKVSEVITSGSVDKSDSYQGVPIKKSIRKGATMVTMSINHPDIEDFITAKSVPNKLTKMNMSVLISDAFMYSVENDLDWDLWFPDTHFDKYDDEWDGDFEKWAESGYPFVVYKTMRARDLWDLLLKNTYTRNEPGILFIDNVRKMDNLHYITGSITATNPCVVSGTLVSTANGLAPVEAVKVGDLIQTTLGFNPVKEVKVYENCDVYRVTFNDGFYQDVTQGHIFHNMDNGGEARKTWNNERRLSELDNDYFVRKEWYHAFPSLDNSLSRDEGLLVGLYLGDGCFSNYCGFNISTCYSEDNSYIEKLFNGLGGGFRVDKSEGDCCRLYMTDNTEYLISLFKRLSIDPKDKSFDLCTLLNTNKNFIFGLIDGLLSSDGNVNNTSRYSQVRFKNTNLHIHKLMKHLMLFIKADYKIYLSGKEGEVSEIYGREVERKQDCYEGVIENDAILNLFTNLGGLSHVSKGELLCHIIKTKQLNGVKWKTKIKSIEYIGKATAYDLYEAIADDWNHEGYVSRGCGEVPGNTGIVKYEGKTYELGDVCNLGSINVARFYDIATKTFNYGAFLKTVDLMVRSLDRIIEISNYPLKMYEDAAKLKRKIGVGLMGPGSLFMMMDVRYGSPESIVFLEDLLSKFMNQAYQTSALLAKELGPFPLYNKKLLKGGYVKNSGVLTEETLAMVKEYGLRNCALSAIAPNGTLSIVAGNVSGGLEPVFAKEFTRWNRVEGKQVDFKYPNVHKGEWFETDYLKEQNVADEVVLIAKDGEYRVDKNNGLCKKVTIKDYGYLHAERLLHKETATSMELTVEEHLEVLRLFAKYIDQSCSKTINLPNDISFEDFKELYGKIHDFGVKGCTTYREGTSVGVLETQKKEKEKSVRAQQKEFLAAFKDQEDGKLVTDNVKLPSEYPAKGFVLRSEGKKWYLHVAFKDKACTRPFALFVNTNNKEDNVVTYNALEKLEELANHAGVKETYIEEVKRKSAYQKNPVKICRMLGLILRHNVDVYEIVKALDELNGATVGTFVHRIKKFLAQFITKIDDPILCPECNEKAIVFESGCYACKNCGNTKC